MSRFTMSAHRRFMPAVVQTPAATWLTSAVAWFTSVVALLCPAVAQAAEPHVTAKDALGDAMHLRIDTDASWGIGSQMFLGAQVHSLLQWPMWHSSDATGSIDMSLRLAYGNETKALAPWRDADDRNQLHRFQSQVGIGHTFHMTEERRVALGLHALIGWSHFNRHAYIDWPDEGLVADRQRGDNNVVISSEVTLAYRFHDHVGLNLAIGAPFPTESNYLITMVHTSAGLSFYVF